MNVMRQLILALVLCASLPAPVPRAQGGEAPADDADTSATTAEQRRRALAELSAAARRSLDAGDGAQAGRFLNRAGRLQLQLSLLDEASQTFRDALAALEQTPDSAAVKVDSLNGIGAAYGRLGECDKARRPLDRAVALSERSDYVAGKAEALLTLSVCQASDDHALALRTAHEALALWQSINRPDGVARAYTAIGEYHLARNNAAEATQSHEAALSIWRELNVPSEQAKALINLGYAEYPKGDWDKAFHYLTQAQELIDENAEPYMMGQINAGLATAFIESGLPEAGLVKYNLALDYYRRTHDPRAIAAAVWGIGQTYYYLKNYAAALEHLQRARAAAEAVRDSTLVALCDDFLGQTSGAANEHASAIHHFEAALKFYTKDERPLDAARVRALMGQIYQRQGDAGRARREYQAALKTFSDLSDNINQSATLYALGSLELSLNNLDAAEHYLGQAIDATENVRRVSSSRDLTAAFSATVYERYEKYVECLMRQDEAQPSRNLAVRAFEVSDIARARSVAELLRSTQTNLVPGLDPELAERERTLRHTRRVKGDAKVALLGRKYEAQELAALEAELARLDAEYRQVTDTIHSRYPSYEQLTRPTAWDLRRIQEQVVSDDETVLLEYALGTDRSYVWAVTRDGFRSYTLPPGAEIKGAAQRVYNSLKNRPGAGGADDPAPRRELSRLILSPVAGELGKRRLIVVADGDLNYIPFQALPNPQGEGELLSDSHEVVNELSASILGELQQEAARRRPAPKVLAAFGNPVFGSNYAQHAGVEGDAQIAASVSMNDERWRLALRDIELNGDSFDPSVIKPLFYAGPELAHLQEVTAGGETFVASGLAATRERLLGTDLSQYAILHFATHGFLDPKRPENSGLVLSTVDHEGREQDGFVGLQSIYGLRAPVNLVVLSACQTALGKDVRGEGLLGLTRGFMYAGASSVVASLWKVDDEATAELMKQFYTNMLKKGQTPAAALRAAQNSIRQRPEWSSPHYWAAFTLQGEYRQVIAPAPDASAAILKLAGGLALLTLLGWGAWRYRGRSRRAATRR